MLKSGLNYYYIPKECPMCHETVNYWDMTWLDGKYTCVDCYYKQIYEKDLQEEYEKEVRNRIYREYDSDYDGED